MKNINIEILDSVKKIAKYYEDRVVLLKLLVEFSSDPEGVIYKLTGLPILSSDDQDKFVMYNKGLIGVNTKDTSITLANKELYRVIDKLTSDMLVAIEAMITVDPVNDAIDNSKVLFEYLDEAMVNNLFNKLNADKVMTEYSETKILKVLGGMLEPGSTNDDVINFMYSLSDSINNLHNAIVTTIVSGHKESAKAVSASMSIDAKNIESNLDGLVNVIEPVELNVTVDDVELAIGSDILIDYIVQSKHEIGNNTLFKALGSLYNDIKQTELTIDSISADLTLPKYDNLKSVIGMLDKVVARYKKDELTNKEFSKLNEEYTYMFIQVMNSVSVLVNNAVQNDNALNKLIYTLYLMKATTETVLVESTID